MGTTEPIKDTTELRNFIEYYKVEKMSARNYLLIVMGLNTALRISDILTLRWENVYDFKKRKIRKYIILKEMKTGKEQKIVINKMLSDAITSLYMEKKDIITPLSYLFQSQKNNQTPISRIQAYRLIKEAAIATITYHEHISCHSLRKTLGYQAWQQGAQPALLMEIYNHSSYNITKRYLGIDQDEKDELIREIKY